MKLELSEKEEQLFSRLSLFVALPTNDMILFSGHRFSSVIHQINKKHKLTGKPKILSKPSGNGRQWIFWIEGN